MKFFGERIERGYALTPRTINLFLLRTQYALVRVKGIEPSTYCLKGNCSTTELHSHLASAVGVEPTLIEPKSIVLPLDDTEI